MQRMNPAERLARTESPAKKNVPRARPAKVKPATAADWVSGARLRTLPLAIAPVALGTGAAVVASGPGVFHPERAPAALVVPCACRSA
jgi:1,4-dihydroxy-2-naphthoate octaprenyltransferase